MTRKAASTSRATATVLALATLTAILAGCTGESSSLPGALSAAPAASTTAASNYSAFPDKVMTAEETAQSGSGLIHPFADPNDREDGGRQVIDNPTLAEILEPGSLPEIVIGKADAPITIVEYASLTCPHCAKFHKEVYPELKREYLDTGKVRLIWREFPIGKTSGLATITLRCAKPEKQVQLIAKYFEQQNQWVSQEVRPDPVFAVAKQVGMTRPEFDACRQNQSIIEALKAIKERGRKLGIIGTPNFFIGDKRIKSTLTMADIRATVDPLLQGARPAATAQR